MSEPVHAPVPGERDADEQQQCDGPYFCTFFTLEVSLGLELRDEAVHLRPVPAQPYEHALDEDDNERHGDHVPDDRRRQRQRIIKTEGDAVGAALRATPQRAAWI